jgi:hypothetical protein
MEDQDDYDYTDESISDSSLLDDGILEKNEFVHNYIPVSRSNRGLSNVRPTNALSQRKSYVPVQSNQNESHDDYTDSESDYDNEEELNQHYDNEEELNQHYNNDYGNYSESESDDYEPITPPSKQRSQTKSLSRMSASEMKKIANPVSKKKYIKEEQLNIPQKGRPRGKLTIGTGDKMANSQQQKTLEKGYFECDVCGKVLKRRYAAAHRRSAFHKAHENINKQLKEFIWDQNKISQIHNISKNMRKRK